MKQLQVDRVLNDLKAARSVAVAAGKKTDLKQVENDPHSAGAIYDRALTFVGSLAKDDLNERADPMVRRSDRFPG